VLEIETHMLVDRPRTLPIGFFVQKKRLQRFKIETYLSDHDYLIIRAKSRYQTDLLAICQDVFPALVYDIDGWTWQQLAIESESTIDELISTMPVADALTMLANIRHIEISDELYFKADCPQCGANNDDNPKTKDCHSLGGIDINFWHSEAEPIVAVELSRYRPKLYPLQLADLASFSADERPLDLRWAAYHIYEIPGLYDRAIDGLLSPEIYAQAIRTPLDRYELLELSNHLSQLGPQLELINECVACGYDWNSRLPEEDRSEFFLGLLSTPEEIDMVNMAFYLTFGEQAPCKSIEEVGRLPVRIRDALIQKLTETYKNQQDEMKKQNRKGGGGSTEYV
jgi:hypothetical protein